LVSHDGDETKLGFGGFELSTDACQAEKWASNESLMSFKLIKTKCSLQSA
jgi:hypothetical protein